MRKITLLYLFIFISSLGFSATKNKSENKNVFIEIQIEDTQSQKAVDWQKGMTALEALQRAAQVKTHPVGAFVFVTSINQLEAKRGDMAWYYKINGKSPSQLAIRQTVKPGDTITWRYVKDVCSCKVDGCKSIKQGR